MAARRTWREACAQIAAVVADGLRIIAVWSALESVTKHASEIDISAALMNVIAKHNSAILVRARYVGDFD